MKMIWIVTAMEFRLFLRSKVSWLLVAFMLLSSFMVVSAGARWNAYSFWATLGMVSLLLTLILAFSTGNQLQRDRDRRLEGIILSTPITTATYVCGKYLAGLLLILGFAVLNLVGSVVLDAIIPASNYPALGPWPYVTSWCILVLVPLVFGAALALLITTFTRGQRVVTSMALILIWLVPFYASAGNSLANLFNVSGLFFDSIDAAQKLGMTFGGPAAPSPAFAQQVVQLVQVHVPWDHLTSTLWLNRAMFLLLAAGCLLGTIRSLHRQRQGS
jgi:ABC-type transport system involved in multi-copper enzyme maturation permease subunit